jgi:hypothetical protein
MMAQAIEQIQFFDKHSFTPPKAARPGINTPGFGLQFF